MAAVGRRARDWASCSSVTFVWMATVVGSSAFMMCMNVAHWLTTSSNNVTCPTCAHLAASRIPARTMRYISHRIAPCQIEWISVQAIPTIGDDDEYTNIGDQAAWGRITND